MNEFWKTSFDKKSENRANNFLTAQEPIKNDHIFYRNWVKVVSGHYSEFQDLWEIVMIHSVICETIGSMMNQHGGKNKHLDPSFKAQWPKWSLGFDKLFLKIP